MIFFVCVGYREYEQPRALEFSKPNVGQLRVSENSCASGFSSGPACARPVGADHDTWALDAPALPKPVSTHKWTSSYRRTKCHSANLK